VKFWLKIGVVMLKFKKSAHFVTGLVVVILGLGLLIFPPTAKAYVGALVRDDYVGEYHISVWVSPNPIAVGNVKLLMRLAKKQNVSQELPVRGAKVQMRFEHLSGPGTEAKPAIANQKLSPVLFVGETEPGNYEGANSIANHGDYRVLFTIEDNGKVTDYSFTFYAQPEANDLPISLTILGLIVLFIFSLAIIYIRQYNTPTKDENVSAQTATETISTKR
jgi:hypothetical protein